jgi:hypothetical protein
LQVRDKLTTAAGLCGVICISVAAFLVAVPLGLAVTGAALIAVDVIEGSR